MLAQTTRNSANRPSGDDSLRPPVPIRLGARPAFIVQAAISIAFLAASSAPTPLYAIYQQQFTLTPVVVTLVFAAYAIALLLALLVVGSLSDYVGRRPVILGALALEVVAMVVFIVSNDAGMLTAARILQGLATGAATAALGAGLADLSPKQAPVVNSVAPIAGMAIGALGTAAVAATVATPTIDVFVILAALFAVLFVAGVFLPETVALRPGALRSLRVSARIPAVAKKAFAVATPIIIAVWAIGGFYLSLGPSLARELTGNDSPLIGGLLVFALTASGAIAVVALKGTAAHRVFMIGAVALVAGLALTLIGVVTALPALLFGGTAVAGIGFGAGFQGAMRTVLPLADASDRAGLLSTLYVISYLAMGVPAIAAGLLASTWGIEAASLLMGGVVIALALIALVAIVRHTRSTR